jgi:hypothetical protein
MLVAHAISFEPDFASPGEWAAMYRAVGWQVVPSHLPSEHQNWKRPALADWKSLQEELVPEATFERWYGPQGEHARRTNMGLLSGKASGNVFVIDLDEYKTPSAAAWWSGALALHNSGIEPETWQQVTGGGGRQLFFKAPPGWRAPTNKTPIGVDVRGQGGFAVLPPSMHVSGKPYEWKAGFSPWECELSEAPAWLLEAVSELVERYGGDQNRQDTGPRVQTESAGADFDAFGARVDGRDHYMRDLIWAAVTNWYRECPIPPTEAESQARMRDAYQVYERKVKSRLDGAESNAALLEKEGRGATMFAEKWRRAVGKWSTEIADAAQRPLAKDEWREATHPTPAAKVSPGRFVFEKIDDLRKLPPAQWLVKDWIPDGATGIFYGKWAAGKSFVCFDLGLHLAYGMDDWHGAALPGEPQDVLVIAREGHQGFVNRIDAFKKHYGLVDDAERITFMRGSVSFMRDEEFAALCEAVRATGVKFRMVIVDTVARVLPGVDMNEQQTITTFMERIAVLGEITRATSIGVHHQNKSGGMMGSVFFEANADFVFEVSRDGDNEGPLRSGEILCTKQKDGEDGWKRAIAYSKIALSIAPDGPSSLIVQRIGNHPARAKDTWPHADVCRRVLAFIHEEWSSGKPLSNAVNLKDQGRYAVSVITKKFELSRSVVEMILKSWLEVRPAILSVETYDKKSKQKGLRVVGQID